MLEQMQESGPAGCGGDQQRGCRESREMARFRICRAGCMVTQATSTGAGRTWRQQWMLGFKPPAVLDHVNVNWGTGGEAVQSRFGIEFERDVRTEMGSRVFVFM